jgi:hypothetical protein
VQRSPLFEKIMKSAASSARSTSQSAKTTNGLLPPSSIENFLSPACWTMRLPVRVEPVKEIARTSGCVQSASPASAPMPWTTLKTPGGTPASSASAPSRSAVSGESSLIFSTAVLPKARQGAVFQVAVMNGTFHGETRAQTPTGWKSV